MDTEFVGTCHATGVTVRMAPEAVTLNVTFGQHWYGYTCAGCGDYHLTECSSEAAQLIQSGGVPLIPTRYSAELDEAMTGPALTDADEVWFRSRVAVCGDYLAGIVESEDAS